MRFLRLQKYKDIANTLRRDVLKMTTKAGSGHPTSCLSCAEIISALFFYNLRYDTKNANNSDNDEFILSKGHAAPILYAALKRAGCIKTDLNSLRKLTSPLEGHPMPNSLSWIKVATGSLGQGLSVGVGMALAAELQKKKYMTYVLMGDSELSEGSVYEALQLASHNHLHNLCAIIDVNRLGQRGETMLGHNIKAYKKRFKSFGWRVIKIDGHNIKSVINSIEKARKTTKPTVILAKTYKGKGVKFIENKNGWHGKALTVEQLSEALKEIPETEFPKIKIKKPKKVKKARFKKHSKIIRKYPSDEQISTREAYGHTLADLAELNPSIVALDSEVSNSTYAQEVKKIKPRQFIETYISEQNMVGTALGLAVKGHNVFASTFAAFLTRAHDQIRMAALSSADMAFCGSHAGVSIGEDGASQMGVEDLAMFRALPHSTIFYPSDAVSTNKLVKLAAKKLGIKYIRTTRAKTPVIYKNNETFPVGDFKVLAQNPKDKLVLIGSGITLHESLKAHEQLKKEKIKTAVIDLYCIKPLDTKKLTYFIKKHGKKVVIAEDHLSEGGIGEMISKALANTGIQIETLNVHKLPHSGKPDQLLQAQGIDANTIAKTAKKLSK